MKNFTIMMFTVATTSMSDDTAYMDEDLPTFDRNTLENIMMCSANDAEDMRKLKQLCQKLFGEIEKRALACQKFLVTEQKIIDAVNLVHVSPVFGHDSNYANYLGRVEYNLTGHVVRAKSIRRDLIQ